MTDQWNHDTASRDTQAPDGRSHDERWIRRPRRSTGDRKIAGVAGGLGRAFGIDPVLIRVAFVVLTIFGGFGGLLYVLGWLLLAADGDEVSAAEALLGRGRSSVPPGLAVGLGVVAVITALSTFSWGLPFLPLAIGGLIVLAIMRRRGRSGHRDWRQPRATDQARQWAERGRSLGRQARSGSGWGSDWGSGCGSRTGVGGRGHGPGSPTGSSPFEEPAFWDRPTASTRVDRPAPRSADGVDLTKAGSGPSSSSDPWAGEQRDGPAPRTTPPAWDPLGAAPFAWDLPEPTPLSQTSARPTRRDGGSAARATVGATLLTGVITAAGVFAGWWVLTWAQVSGIALAVLALGLLISALQGRGHSLIGPGVFLSLVTLALAVTGVSGTSGYGVAVFHPASLAEVQSNYSSSAGTITVDLTQIAITKGTTTNVVVNLGGGHAEVLVPENMAIVANCDAQVGNVDCLGKIDDGVSAYATNSRNVSPDTGTLNVTVKVNAGFAQVTDHA